MMFVNSLKLIGSNWAKLLKFLLYYVCIWGVCIALFLPVIFEFKDIIVENIKATEMLKACNGVFVGTLGLNLHIVIQTVYAIIFEIFTANIGLVIYAIIVAFLILPFFVNIGKYTLNAMLYSYMTSKNKIGFFSALVKNLKKSTIFALTKTLYNILFFVITLASIYGLSMVVNEIFVVYFLPIILFIVLVLLFTLHQITVLGWSSALIVFDCNVFSAYKKGIKAVKRHFWSIFGTTTLYFVLFWALVMIFGVYTLVALIPIMAAVLCVYDMVVFFASQGMRFYVNDRNILTPKKLEEVDNINKTAFIL